MSDDKIFLDTNVIVYAYDRSAAEKHKIAREILMDLWSSGQGVVSTQVLQEFFVNVTRKIPRPMSLRQARQILADFLKWDVVLINGNILLNAIDLQLKHKFSFWDSIIVCAAITSGAKTLYSEDLQDGVTVGGVVIKNPFA